MFGALHVECAEAWIKANLSDKADGACVFCGDYVPPAFLNCRTRYYLMYYYFITIFFLYGILRFLGNSIIALLLDELCRFLKFVLRKRSNRREIKAWTRLFLVS